MSINQRILRVNLTAGQITIEEPSESFFREYFGGRGIISYYLLKELKAHIDPLGPENKLIFAGGPLSGSPVAGAGRNSVGAKSPLSGTYGDSEAGGYWGAELNKAGFDAVIIEGKAPAPVYLWIKDGKAEIRSAEKLWGKKTAVVQVQIQEELEDSRIRVAQIGIAGENLVRYACVVNDLTHFYGRSGMGAVMGSKNLRAIAVRGTTNSKIANPEKLKEVNQWMAQNYKEKVAHLTEFGTPFFVNLLNDAGGLPTRNFTSGQFEGAKDICGQTMKEKYHVNNETCYACPIRCKRVVKIEGEMNVDPIYGGPEYESVASLGSVLGINNLAAIIKGNELCNSYGLDTISAGVTLSFVMECFEKGLITKEDTNGIELKFGDAEGMLEMIELIAHRKEFGDILSQGVKAVSEKFGPHTSELAMHVKGQEIPMHEPRFKAGLGVGYMVSPTGADHCHNIHDTYFYVTADAMKPLGLLEPIPLQDIGTQKMRLLAYYGNWRHFDNCALLCIFVPWGYRHVVEMVEAVTGWSTSLWELLRVGERAANLCRLFNIREGFTKEDDMLKSRWYKEAFSDGPLKNFQFTQADLEQARFEFYQIMGWDAEGIPTKGKLLDLGIEWTEEYLK